MMKRLMTLTMLIAMLGAYFIPMQAVSAQADNPCDGYEPVDSASGLTLNGGAGSQVLIGSIGPDVLRGGAGNDVLCGFGGDDVLYGGSGNDILVGGDGFDTLRGESGNDTMINGEDNRGGSGNDVESFTPSGVTCDDISANICVPAGASVTFTTSITACNRIDFSYEVNGVDLGVVASRTENACTSLPPASQNYGKTTVGPFSDSDAVALTLNLTDSCATFDSDGNPVDHATISSTSSGVLVDIHDSGDDCRLVNEERSPTSGAGNLSVDVAINS